MITPNGIIENYWDDPLPKLIDQLHEKSFNLILQLQKTEQSIEAVARVENDTQFDNFANDFEKNKETIRFLGEMIDTFATDNIKPLYEKIMEYHRL